LARHLPDKICDIRKKICCQITRFCEKIACEGSRLARYGALPMSKLSPLPLIILSAALCTASATTASAAGSQFKFKDANGKTQSVSVVSEFYPKKLQQYPAAKVDRKINPTLMRAATIAQERARAHSKSLCWRYVKEALLASGAVNSYPKTANAKEAGQELVQNYGFKKAPVNDPFKAPVGAVLVYGAKKAAGHVEIRTKDGFVSDFRSKTPSPRPLLGIYTKG